MRKTSFFQMSLVFVTLGVAKTVDISIAVDICRLKTAQKLKLYVGRHFLVAFSITSVFKKTNVGPFICNLHSFENFMSN